MPFRNRPRAAEHPLVHVRECLDSRAPPGEARDRTQTAYRKMLREDIVHQPVAYIPVIVARRSMAPATLLVLAASGSSRAAPASDQFPSQTDVVRIQISVVDSRGRPVLDLTQQASRSPKRVGSKRSPSLNAAASLRRPPQTR